MILQRTLGAFALVVSIGEYVNRSVLTGKPSPYYWPFAWKIHRLITRSQYCGALIFSLLLIWTSSWKTDELPVIWEDMKWLYSNVIKTTENILKIMTRNIESLPQKAYAKIFILVLFFLLIFCSQSGWMISDSWEHSCSECSIVGYGTGAFWYSWIRSIDQFFQYKQVHWILSVYVLSDICFPVTYCASLITIAVVAP